MLKDFRTVLVVDIEATCWNYPPPPGMEEEIIEIGVVELDLETGERRNKTSVLVKPARSRVGKFCTKMTGITQRELERGGMSFSKACEKLRTEFRAQDRAWASFGEYDRLKMTKQCKAFGVEYPFNRDNHIDIRVMFALWHQLKEPCGLKKAMEMLGIPMEGDHHRGDDDAWNAAAVLARIIMHPAPNTNNDEETDGQKAKRVRPGRRKV